MLVRNGPFPYTSPYLTRLVKQSPLPSATETGHMVPCGHMTHTGLDNKKPAQAFAGPIGEADRLINGSSECPRAIFASVSLPEYQGAGCYQEADWLKRGSESPRLT